MSNKTPYEIRFDTLQMAKQMLDREYDTQLSRFYDAMEIAKTQQKDMKDFFETYTPKMYQPKEVMKKAEELYSFITKKG